MEVLVIPESYSSDDDINYDVSSSEYPLEMMINKFNNNSDSNSNSDSDSDSDSDYYSSNDSDTSEHKSPNITNVDQNVIHTQNILSVPKTTKTREIIEQKLKITRSISEIWLMYPEEIESFVLELEGARKKSKRKLIAVEDMYESYKPIKTLPCLQLLLAPISPPVSTKPADDLIICPVVSYIPDEIALEDNQSNDGEFDLEEFLSDTKKICFESDEDLSVMIVSSSEDTFYGHNNDATKLINICDQELVETENDNESESEAIKSIYRLNLDDTDNNIPTINMNCPRLELDDTQDLQTSQDIQDVRDVQDVQDIQDTQDIQNINKVQPIIQESQNLQGFIDIQNFKHLQNLNEKSCDQIQNISELSIIDNNNNYHDTVGDDMGESILPLILDALNTKSIESCDVLLDMVISLKREEKQLIFQEILKIDYYLKFVINFIKIFENDINVTYDNYKIFTILLKTNNSNKIEIFEYLIDHYPIVNVDNIFYVLCNSIELNNITFVDIIIKKYTTHVEYLLKNNNYELLSELKRYNKNMHDYIIKKYEFVNNDNEIKYNSFHDYLEKQLNSDLKLCNNDDNDTSINPVSLQELINSIENLPNNKFATRSFKEKFGNFYKNSHTHQKYISEIMRVFAHHKNIYLLEKTTQLFRNIFKNEIFLGKIYNMLLSEIDENDTIIDWFLRKFKNSARRLIERDY
jgi:hypothetical protein